MGARFRSARKTKAKENGREQERVVVYIKRLKQEALAGSFEGVRRVLRILFRYTFIWRLYEKE